MAARADGPAQLGIQSFYGVRCINDPTNVARKAEKRDDFLPYPAPALADGGVFLAPWTGLEIGESGLGGPGINGPVDHRNGVEKVDWWEF